MARSSCNEKRVYIYEEIPSFFYNSAVCLWMTSVASKIRGSAWVWNKGFSGQLN